MRRKSSALKVSFWVCLYKSVVTGQTGKDIGVKERRYGDMIQLRIRNSSLAVFITLQYWPGSSIMPFLQGLRKNGFNITSPSLAQSPTTIAWKDSTSNVGVDYASRRVFFQITNNLSSPHENVAEILSLLSSIGYESIDRIDVNGEVTISVDGPLSSTLIEPMIKPEFVGKVGQIFKRPMKVTGIRIASTDSLTGDVLKKPFVMLIEPLLTDPSDRTLFTQLFYSSRSGIDTINFLKSLYSALKEIILDNNV